MPSSTLRRARRAALAVLLLATRAAPAAARPAGPPREPAPRLACAVDPAVELFSVLALLAGRMENELDHAYRRDALAWFAPVADHPAVRRVRAIMGQGFTDFPALAGSQFGPPPALAPRAPLVGAVSSGNTIDAATIRSLAVDARAFARASDAAGFLRRHEPLYASLCAAALADSAAAGAPALVERVFGVPSARYVVSPMPLVRGLGVAATGRGAGAGATLVAFVGPVAVENDAPVLRHGWGLSRVIMHEFAHQHVNPAVRRVVPQLAASAPLFEPLRERLWRTDRIARWTDAVVETMVRAAVAVARGDEAGDEAMRAELDDQRALGFLLVDSAAAALRDARDAGGPAPTVDAAMPRFVALLDRAARAALPAPPFGGTMLHAFAEAREGALVFVLPTEERDTAAQRALGEHVRAQGLSRHPGARVLTDREALDADLRDAVVWAIGTVDGNAWIRAHRDAVAARVDADSITTGVVHRGRDLVFLTAVPNPDAPRRPLLLTVAQRTESLLCCWWELASEYAVVDGGRVRERGTYARDGARRVFAGGDAAVSSEPPRGRAVERP